jgi:hypothetical protein
LLSYSSKRGYPEVPKAVGVNESGNDKPPLHKKNFSKLEGGYKKFPKRPFEKIIGGG